MDSVTINETASNGPGPAKEHKAWSDAVLIGQIPFEESLKEDGEYVVHAVHCVLWAKVVQPLFGLDKDKSIRLAPRAAIMMHLRFDGHIGFLGGKIDETVFGLTVNQAEEIVTSSLNRELMEEGNLDEKHKIRMDNYLFTHQLIREITGTPIFAHFFAYEMSLDDLREMELRSLASREHGREVMGNFRVPLYTMSDGYRGLPAFLTNNFIGNSRTQLLSAIVKLEIMTNDETDKAFAASRLKNV